MNEYPQRTEKAVASGQTPLEPASRPLGCPGRLPSVSSADSGPVAQLDRATDSFPRRAPAESPSEASPSPVPVPTVRSARMSAAHLRSTAATAQQITHASQYAHAPSGTGATMRLRVATKALRAGSVSTSGRGQRAGTPPEDRPASLSTDRVMNGKQPGGTHAGRRTATAVVAAEGRRALTPVNRSVRRQPAPEGRGGGGLLPAPRRAGRPRKTVLAWCWSPSCVVHRSVRYTVGGRAVLSLPEPRPLNAIGLHICKALGHYTLPAVGSAA